MVVDASPARESDRPAIAVAITVTRRCKETLETAAALAASMGADLEVVLVEDANLLRLADLPVTREVDGLSGAARSIDSARVLRAMQCESRELRIALARLERASAMRSTLRVVRGQVFTEALTASGRVGVTFVHGARRNLPGMGLQRAPSTPGSSARRLRKPVIVRFEGGAGGLRALRVAAQLAHTVGDGLTAIVPGGGEGVAEGYKREAREAIGQTDIKFIEWGEGRTRWLGKLLTPSAGCLLVLSRDSRELEDEATREFLEALAIPLVLVA